MPIESEKLRQIPLFTALSAQDLAQVATLTREQHYERSEVILLEGEQNGALFLSIETPWSVPVRTTLFVFSLFSFLLTLSYASLRTQEERGLF